MGKNKRKTNRSFVMLGRGMLWRCEEWKELSSSAKLFYIHLKAKYNGSNNGEIKLHYSELKGVKGVSSASTISKAIKELEQKEWIVKTELGGLFRHSNLFLLTGKHDEVLAASQIIPEKWQGMARYINTLWNTKRENRLDSFKSEASRYYQRKKMAKELRKVKRDTLKNEVEF